MNMEKYFINILIAIVVCAFINQFMYNDWTLFKGFPGALMGVFLKDYWNSKK